MFLIYILERKTELYKRQEDKEGKKKNREKQAELY